MHNSEDLKREMATGVITGDCIEIMRKIGPESVDLIVTDPPYLCNYHSRDGQTVANDNDGSWIAPAFAEMYRLLKPDSFCVSFYGWQSVDEFMAAWKAAGFSIVGNLVFTKDYASNKGALSYTHEQAYVLAKGTPEPYALIADVIPWGRYTGNQLHPTQKPVEAISPLIAAFSREGDAVLDPFCGSGTTLIAARDLRRSYLGIELVPDHAETARERAKARQEYGYSQPEEGRYVELPRNAHILRDDFRRDFDPAPRSERPSEDRGRRPSWADPRRPWLPYEEWLARKRGMRRGYRNW